MRLILSRLDIGVPSMVSSWNQERCSTSGRLTGRSYVASVHISPDSLSPTEAFRHRTTSVSEGWRSLLVFPVYSKPKRLFHSPYCPISLERSIFLSHRIPLHFRLGDLLNMFLAMDALECSFGHTAELFSSFNARSNYVGLIVFG